MKLSKEELLKKVNEMEIEEEKKVELIEDISDSMEVDDGYKEKYDELLIKYKERFFEPKTEEKAESEEETEDEEKIIDVKEI